MVSVNNTPTQTAPSADQQQEHSVTLTGWLWVRRDLRGDPSPHPCRGLAAPPAQAAQGPSAALATSRNKALTTVL